MMNITIDEAIKAMSLFRDTAPENGYVASCYNMAISALKTIQDGNYKLESENVSRETLKKLVNEECKYDRCIDCPLHVEPSPTRSIAGVHECKSCSTFT